jgi:hypothetical protein
VKSESLALRLCALATCCAAMLLAAGCSTQVRVHPLENRLESGSISSARSRCTAWSMARRSGQADKGLRPFLIPTSCISEDARHALVR